MTDLYQTIKNRVAADLVISLGNMRNLSATAIGDGRPVIVVGDEIQFDIMLKNDNAFPVADLEVTIHQVQAVEFEENPVVGGVQMLNSGEVAKVATVKGIVRTDPDDAKSAWRTLDYLCKVSVNGKIDLPPIEFQDEEFKVAHITNS